jgi:hypothetical protein
MYKIPMDKHPVNTDRRSRQGVQSPRTEGRFISNPSANNTAGIEYQVDDL